MKLVNLSVCALVAVVGMASAASAQAPAADWTFEVSQPITDGPHEAELGTNASGSEATMTHAAAHVVSSPAGNGSTHSFSSTGWAIGDYFQYMLATTGYSTMTAQFDHTSSNTGPRDWTLSYSLNGVGFTSLLDYSVLANAAPNPTWGVVTRQAIYQVSAALPAALNNQPVIFLRMTVRTAISANGGVLAAGGTSRMDNVIVPTPGAAALLGLGGLIAGRRRRA